MIAELGNITLIIALSTAIAQLIIPLMGFVLKIKSLVSLAKPLAFAQSIWLAISISILIYGLITDDFSIKYIAENSNTNLPDMFKVSATWGAHEGSLLLWSFILSLWTVAVAIFSKQVPREIVSHILIIMGGISVGFISFLFFTSNPFDLIAIVPMEGRELNPLLQDFGLIIHPPLLYMGYVGMAVPFSFVVSALIRGEMDSAWIKWSRPWTLVAWAFLTIGITLGSWWAYYELGWGGWWFWDPVENASFMPWLVATALIHSLSVSEKRGAFKHWTVLLALSAFSLSLLGTFLVRSGILTSVHSFASDPERGIFILIFLLIVIGGSLLLYAIRATKMTSVNKFSLISKETGLLMNNILLVAAAMSVFLGTMYPLLMDSLDLGKISVGSPYFNAVFIPIMIPAVFLLAVVPFIRWKKDNVEKILERIYIPVGSALVSLISLIWIDNYYVVLSILIFAWIGFHSLLMIFNKLKSTGRVSLSFVGMILAHMGIAVFALGATVTTQYGVEKDLKLSIGERITIEGYEFKFNGAEKFTGANYKGYRGDIEFSTKGEAVRTLRPEKRMYSTGMPMTEAAIHPTLYRDIYVALGEKLDEGSWSVRIYYKPLIRLIWLGGLLIMLGGFLAAMDKRYIRRRVKG